MATNQTRSEAPASGKRPVFISYKRDAEADRSLAVFLHDSLARHGSQVFIDLEIPPGSDWSEVISNGIRNCDFFVVLLSEASAAHGFVLAETLIAHDTYTATGHPRILPVRVAFTKNLPLRLSAVVGHLQHFEWRDPADNDELVDVVLEAIGKSDPDPEPTSRLLRGDHFIVTKRLWHATGARESVAGTAIVPVTVGQETSLAVTRTKGPGFFAVRILDDGALEVAIWKGAEYRRVSSEPGRFISMLEGDSHRWCFAQYRADEPVLLPRADGRKDPIVVTFDPEVVKTAWLITHQRGAQSEKFLIAGKGHQPNN